MEPQTIKFVGAPCGRHGPYTFYKAFKYEDPKKEGRLRVLSLGEFFFAKISQEAPLCCAELQLLWEDKNNENILLSSVRLYFLPEHTPDGRQVFHGEDEVLADGEKVVLKIEDLLQWIVHPDDASAWTTGTRAASVQFDVADQDQDKMLQMFAANNSGLQLEDIRKEKKLCDNGEKSKVQVLILSYSQYCRYRGILKRLESVADKWLKSAIVCAIGGFTLPHNCDNTYVLFCKDTFEHPELQDHKFRKDQWAPNLKGRPRKKKLNFHKLNGGDSSDSETSALEKNFSRDTISKEVKKRHSTRMRGEDLSREEQAFFEVLYKFMKDRKTPIERIPSLGFKQLDLYAFYTMSQKLGGYDKVCEKKLWKGLYDKLGGNPGNTSAATCTRRHYERLLLPFERSKKGQEFKFSEKDKKKGRSPDMKKDGELKKGKADKSAAANKKQNNTILADRAKHLQTMREQSLQKQQNQKSTVRKTVKHELEIRNQNKDSVANQPVKPEPQSPAKTKPANHILEKTSGAATKSVDTKSVDRQVVNGAAVNSRVPPPGVVLPDKAQRNKILGHNSSSSRNFPLQPVPLRLPHNSQIASQQQRPQHLPVTVPPHYLQQQLSKSFQQEQKPSVAGPPTLPPPLGVSGRPSVIQHTAAHLGPPTAFGPPGVFGDRKRPFPFGEVSSSLVNDVRQPFPTPPPAHSNPQRSSVYGDPRHLTHSVDIKRMRMEDARHRGTAPADEKKAVINLECNERLEPMDFSLRGENIKTTVKSDDEPLCLVTHTRKDKERSGERRKSQQPHAPWQTTHKSGAASTSTHSHGSRQALKSSVNHPASKHDTANSRMEHSHSHSHSRHLGSHPAHPSTVLGPNKLTSAAGYMFSPPQSISSGLPPHGPVPHSSAGSGSNSSSASRSNSSSNSGNSSSQRQQQQPTVQHPTPRPTAAVPTNRPDPMLDALTASGLLHRAFFPPGMLPQIPPQYLFPGLLSPSALPGVGLGVGLGVDGVSPAVSAAQSASAAASAMVTPGAAALQAGAPVASPYLIPVPAQAFQSLYLNRPPRSST